MIANDRRARAVQLALVTCCFVTLCGPAMAEEIKDEIKDAESALAKEV